MHSDYKFSIIIHSDDLAVVNCLRALAKYSQKTGNNNIPWGNTKEKDWETSENKVTFHFSSSEYRDFFEKELMRLLPHNLWKTTSRSNSDPARPAKK